MDYEANNAIMSFLLLTLKVLNFWKFTSYCSLKPLWSGMGEVVPARTSPTLHPPFPLTVHQLSWLALWELTQVAFFSWISIVLECMNGSPRGKWKIIYEMGYEETIINHGVSFCFTLIRSFVLHERHHSDICNSKGRKKRQKEEYYIRFMASYQSTSLTLFIWIGGIVLFTHQCPGETGSL